MKFTQIYTDAQGETHFGDLDLPEQVKAFGPPPNPTGVMSDFGATTGMFVFTMPGGTNVPAHNAPQPYISIMLQGSVDVTASDGETRRFGPGDVLFCNDLTGKGHTTLSITDVTGAFVNRA